MLINSLIIDFNLLYVSSLKERRNIISSIKSKLSKYNVSILDISSEYPKEASIAIAYLTHNRVDSYKIKEKIEKLILNSFAEIEFESYLEII